MIIKSLAALVLLGASSLLVPQDEEPAQKGGDYAVDPAHSSVLFRVTHLGVSNFYGRFNDVSGTVHYEPEHPEKSTVSIRIATDSVDTNSEGRDKHLESPDFFNATEFPALTFASTQVKAGAKGALAVTGDLTLHGVTHSVSFDATPTGYGDRGRMGYRAGFEAQLGIARSDYGMDYMVGMLGDEVNITVALETVLP